MTQSLTGSGGPKRVGYVISQFPCVDEVFILREIEAVARHGIDLRIYSLRNLEQPVVQEAARPFLAVTRYSPYVLSTTVWRAVFATIVTQPRTLLTSLVEIAWRLRARPTALLKSLAVLPKALAFLAAARRDGVEHLHAHWATYPATAAMVMARLGGIPWSLTCHAHDIYLDPSLLPEKLARAQFVLTCTTDNQRHLETVSPIARAKVRVSYHGLDLERFRPSETVRVTGDLRLLAVGTLVRRKGFDLLISACAELARRAIPFRLTIAGGGPCAAELANLATSHGIADRVHFTGAITQDTLLPLYAEADVFVLPFRLGEHFGLPNVLIEAQACGLAVITTPLPAVPELIDDGVNGLIARDGDVVDLAAKLARLAADPWLRAAMGVAGRRRVEQRFDIRRTITDVVDALGGTPT